MIKKELICSSVVFEKIKLWGYFISRGYTLPMSLLPCLIAVLYMYSDGGNLLYGILATFGVVFAHLGTNVFDDYIDYVSKTPKQACKTAYLAANLAKPTEIFVFSLVYFIAAFLIGLFLMLKSGSPVLVIAFFAGVICIAYPRLNYYCLGEIALFLTFGPLLFAGMSYAMLSEFNTEIILLSVPVVIFILILLITHALMDFDFDVDAGKKTFCTIWGKKEYALNALFVLVGVGYIVTVVEIIFKIMPLIAILTLATIPLAVKLYKQLHLHILSNDREGKNFMKNFKLARNISVIYNVIVLFAAFQRML